MADIDADSWTFAMHGRFFHLKVQGSLKNYSKWIRRVYSHCIVRARMEVRSIISMRISFSRKGSSMAHLQVYLAFRASGHQEVAPGFFCLPQPVYLHGLGVAVTSGPGAIAAAKRRSSTVAHFAESD